MRNIGLGYQVEYSCLAVLELVDAGRSFANHRHLEVSDLDAHRRAIRQACIGNLLRNQMLCLRAGQTFNLHRVDKREVDVAVAVDHILCQRLATLYGVDFVVEHLGKHRQLVCHHDAQVVATLDVQLGHRLHLVVCVDVQIVQQHILFDGAATCGQHHNCCHKP